MFLIDKGVILPTDEINIYPFATKNNKIFPNGLTGKMKLPEASVVCKIKGQRPVDNLKRYPKDAEKVFEGILRNSTFTISPEGTHTVRKFSKHDFKLEAIFS